MFWKRPQDEENHWQIISLANTLLILILLLITLKSRGREKVNRRVCVIPWDSETLGVISSSTPTCSMRLEESFIPLCLACPLDFSLHDLFNLYFYALQNKDFLLGWVDHSLFVLLRWKPWRQAGMGSQKVLVCECRFILPFLSLPFLSLLFRREHRYFSKLERMKYFSPLHARDHPADLFVLCWFSVAQCGHLSFIHCQLFYPSSPLIYSFVTLESNL